MNYIFIEGMAVYVFIFLIIVLVLIAFIGGIMAIICQSRRENLQAELFDEREKNILINRENMRLKLKCGELTVGEHDEV